MFNYKKSKSVMDKVVDHYEEIISSKNEEIANLTAKIVGEIREADVEVDFEAMNAFSVERIMLHGEPVTSVGYFDRENKVREWYLYTSLSTHDKIVDDFREFKFNKYSEE